MLRTFHLAAGVLLLAFASQLAIAKDLPRAKAETVGLSTERLARIAGLQQRYTGEQKIPGMVTMVIRHGKVVYERADGILDVETKAPVKADSLFRIYSMTKPIVHVGALILYEQGRFRLDEPVANYITEFKDLKVLVDGKEVAPERPMTIRQLMTHTAGLSYGFMSNTAVDQLYRQAEVLGSKNLKEMAEKLAKIPLQYQPGTEWRYSVAVDVLGHLIERISGQPLDVYLRDNLFKPLAMDDTFFQVPADKVSRFGTNHGLNRETGKLEVVDSPRGGRFTSEVTFFSGGGGLVGSAPDYLRFCQMLLNGGELDGVRILSPKTVQFLRQNHLPKGVEAGFTGGGFGLGFAVRTGVTQGDLGSVGEYWWGGAAGTLFWIDPVEDMAVVTMVQHMGMPYPLVSEMHTLVNSSLVELEAD